jgi:primosomal protein N' (replication factor Y)
MQYPPVAHILVVLVTAKEEDKSDRAVAFAAEALKEYININELSSQVIGPAPAGLAKAKDIYRRLVYIKDEKYDVLVGIKNYLEGYFSYSGRFVGCNLQFDFNPMSTY